MARYIKSFIVGPKILKEKWKKIGMQMFIPRKCSPKISGYQKFVFYEIFS